MSSSFAAVPVVAAVLSLSVAARSGADYSRTIVVDPERGNNTEGCLTSPDLPCRNLSYAFQYQASSTRYLLLPGTHYLNTTTSFTDLTDIAVTGNTSSPGSVKITCFAENSGLVFFRVKNVVVGNVTLTYCSSLQNGTSRNVSGSSKLLALQTALYFSHCESIAVEDAVVSNSPSASAVTVYNTVGTNTFTRCILDNNIGPLNPSLTGGGGGVYIEFSYCVPGDDSCMNGTEPSYTNSNTDSRYSFTECLFANNNATFTGGDTAISFIAHKYIHNSFGQGGGLSIFFCGNASNNSFLINNCHLSGNSARFGGGLYVEFSDTSANNTVTVLNTSFFNNSCDGGHGGGTNICYFSSHAVNSVSFVDSNFTDNEAMKGGGVRVVAMRKRLNFSLSGARFEGNQGSYGAAVMILMSGIIDSQKPSLSIQNCQFLNNSISLGPYRAPREVGIGAVYIKAVDVTFYGLNVFEHNDGSALCLIGTSVQIANTTMNFTRNSAVNGGAITLLDSAKLLINSNTSLEFYSNRAFVTGGAIYNKFVQKNTYEYLTNCFIEHEDGKRNPDKWGASFVFHDNYDSKGKNAIYTTSVLSCDTTRMQNLSSVFCWEDWTYQYNGEESQNCSEYICTAPGYIAINSTLVEDSSDEVLFVVSAYPGQVTDIPISIFDDLNHTAEAIFSAAENRRTSEQAASLDPDYAYIFRNEIRVLGSPNASLEVYLDSVGDRNWHVKFLVNLTECPPGFVLQPTPLELNGSNFSSPLGGEWEEEEEEDVGMEEGMSTKACECVTSEGNVQTIRCNSATDAALLSGYWMGLDWVDGQREYVVSPCPSGFCRTSRHEYIPLPKENLTEHICGIYKRKGRVCGECVDGYGPAINSYTCVLCNVSNHQLAIHATYYALSVYLPLFLLFLAIIVFNIKLTTGPANSFILFSQLISSTLNINADNRIPLESISPNISIYLKAYKFPYGIFNLQFFELFVPKEYLCLGTNLSVLDIFLLEYLVAFSPLLMIVAIVTVYKVAGSCGRCSACVRGLCRRCCCCCPSRKGEVLGEQSDRLRRAMVPAFASFILLSYTKFSLTSSLIVALAQLTTLSGQPLRPTYFYYAAQNRFNTPENVLHYILPAAFVFVTFVAIPPLMLLDYPLRLFEKVLRRCPLLWQFYPSDKIHIILDAFQGCYRNRYRWFAGLYFIFRLLINATNTVCEDLEQFFYQEFFCILFALLVAFLQPYRRKYHLLNYFDSLIFLNLAVINLITLYLYADTRRGDDPSVSLFVIQYLLVFLPLVYMVGYVSWRVLPVPQVRERVRQWLEARQLSQQMESLIQNRADETSDSTDDVDWERAQVVNRYRRPPLHSSVPPPSSQSWPNDPLAGGHTSSSSGRGRGSGYGSTGRSDSGIAVVNSQPSSQTPTGAATSFSSSNDSPSEQEN